MRLLSLAESKKNKRAHLIGIGGIGMSNLAYWLVAQGFKVSGSDICASETTAELHQAGVKISIGHRRTNLPANCDLVIHSQAVKKNNPEIKEAKRRQVKIFSYPVFVGRLSEKYKTVSVAGAHGKSTTAALLALTLIEGGLDPIVLIGTKLKEFGGRGFRNGDGEYLVLESDEYGGAFLHYSPTLALITNIDREHLDFYRHLNGVKRAFTSFIRKVKRNGILVLNRDNQNLWSLRKTISKIARANKLKIIWYSRRQAVAKKVEEYLYLRGRHNISNAIAVYKAARLLGIEEKKILKVFRNYRGSWRRMEYRGRFKIPASKLRLLVYDDYAHHPTEIKATLEAFREKYPGRKIICVFQPHQAQRLKILFTEFKTAFDAADITLLLPTYEVAGRENKKMSAGKTSLDLARAIQKTQPKKLVFYLADPANLKNALLTLLPPPTPASPSPILVMMGAGNIVNYTSQLVAKS